MYHVMHEKSKEETAEFCSNYFSLEYECDYLIHTYQKPIIGWGEGIVMGGGMGLFMGTSHRVVTLNLVSRCQRSTLGFIQTWVALGFKPNRPRSRFVLRTDWRNGEFK